MIAELISVGTELLLGNIVNTNAQYLAVNCAKTGISVFYQVCVGDNEERLSGAIREALSRSDIIILTGGLGPTKDDLTKETVAKICGLPLVMDEVVKGQIKDYFEKIGKTEITENNWKQAEIIKGCKILYNHNGTAPGLIVELDHKSIILLPGPPSEMKAMFDEAVFPYLKEKNPRVYYSKMVKVCGIGESKAETMIEDLINAQSNPTIAPYAKLGEVHFRVTASADTKEQAKELIKPVIYQLKERFGNCVYTTEEEETLEEVVVRLLKKYELTVTTAESCTGGMIASRIVNVAGCSDVFREGFVTYANKAKRKYLDVNKHTLQKYGAVSEQTAKEMVIGVATKTLSDIALAVTGIAGPDGGTDDKPVGTVYIGCYVKEKAYVKHYQISGDRQKVRETAVIYALDLLRRCIQENYKD